MENSSPEKSKKGIENISDAYRIKESDKLEGIPVYGSKPLGENGEYVPSRTAEEIRQRIALLEKSFKSTNYVGDKSLIEKEIIQLENELRESKFPDKKLKTAKELAMEGKIAWDKGDEAEKPKEQEEEGLSRVKKILQEVGILKPEQV